MLELQVSAQTSAFQTHMIKCPRLSPSGKNRAVKKAHIIVSFFNSIDSTSAVPLRVWYYQWVSLYFLIAIASTSIALSRSSCLRT